LDSQFPFGLIQGVVKGLVPRVSGKAFGTNVKEVIPGRPGTMRDLK
jgi:hypothetical protein